MTIGKLIGAALFVLCAASAAQAVTNDHGASRRDREGIERLHRLDVETTLSDNADELFKLWDRDAVRLQPGPAEVGRAVIYNDDKRWFAKNPKARTLSYKTDVQDIVVTGDWAIEWGYFEASFIASAGAKPVTIHGKQLRVLKRQSDGSWKFARIMGLENKPQ